jgi:hypothetical protein
MHPLFEKASGLTETIIAGAIEVHRGEDHPSAQDIVSKPPASSAFV